MKDIFKKVTISIICSSIIAFIIGLILVINPSMSLETIGIMVGIYIIIHGVSLIVLDFKAIKYCIPFDGIMSGLLSIVLGVLLIAMPNILSTAFGIALGIWVILSSVNTIKMSLAIRNVSTVWVLLLLLGILDLVAGIIILFNPFASSLSATMLGGIIIMAHSVITIIDMIVIKKNVKEISKVVENSIKEYENTNN